jgi:hypothetical protein
LGGDAKASVSGQDKEFGAGSMLLIIRIRELKGTFRDSNWFDYGMVLFVKLGALLYHL